MQSLFPLKDKIDCKSIVIYKGGCSCGSRYIGEIKRNAEDLRKTLGKPLFYMGCHVKRLKKCLDQEEPRIFIHCSLGT